MRAKLSLTMRWMVAVVLVIGAAAVLVEWPASYGRGGYARYLRHARPLDVMESVFVEGGTARGRLSLRVHVAADDVRTYGEDEVAYYRGYGMDPPRHPSTAWETTWLPTSPAMKRAIAKADGPGRLLLPRVSTGSSQHGGLRDPPRFHYLEASAPHWMVAVVLLLPLWGVAAPWRRARRARRRRAAGRCTHCDYDVRATAGRCPECGATSSATVPAAAPSARAAA